MERADEPPPADLLYRIGWYVSVYARDSEVYVKRSGWVGKRKCTCPRRGGEGGEGPEMWA